jgi:hypothetical protein
MRAANDIGRKTSMNRGRHPRPSDDPVPPVEAVGFILLVCPLIPAAPGLFLLEGAACSGGRACIGAPLHSCHLGSARDVRGDAKQKRQR